MTSWTVLSVSGICNTEKILKYINYYQRETSFSITKADEPALIKLALRFSSRRKIWDGSGRGLPRTGTENNLVLLSDPLQTFRRLALFKASYIPAGEETRKLKRW